MFPYWRGSIWGTRSGINQSARKLSRRRDKTEVTEIGCSWLNSVTLGTLGTGQTDAHFHLVGKHPDWMHLLRIFVSTSDSSRANSLRSLVGTSSGWEALEALSFLSRLQTWCTSITGGGDAEGRYADSESRPKGGNWEQIVAKWLFISSAISAGDLLLDNCRGAFRLPVRCLICWCHLPGSVFLRWAILFL